MKETQPQHVDSVVDTHPDWSLVPPHRHHVFLCEGKRCAARGAHAIWAAFGRALRMHERVETADGALLTRTHCQYPCNLGPIATVYPQAVWYHVGDAAAAQRIVEEHLVGGRIVDDLRLPDPERAPLDPGRSPPVPM